MFLEDRDQMCNKYFLPFWVVYITKMKSWYKMCLLWRRLFRNTKNKYDRDEYVSTNMKFEKRSVLLEKKKVTMQNILALYIIGLSLNWHFRRDLIFGIFKKIYLHLQWFTVIISRRIDIMLICMNLIFIVIYFWISIRE